MPSEQKISSFDEFEIDRENFRVLKSGEPISLSPRAFDVLLMLMGNAGRVVEKQEIFNSVWKDTFVGDNALTKVIKEIRHALTDDATNPHYIETVPKRGYRFIAKISEIGSPIGSVLQQVPETSTGSAEADQRPHRSNSVRNRWIFVSLLLIVGLGTGAFYYFDHAQSANEPADNSPIDSIAVLPFENAAKDPSVEYLSDGITESLINGLSKMSGLKVMSLGSVLRYRGPEHDPQTVGSELNVRGILTGSVRQVGEQLVVNVSLDDARGGRHIWGEQYVRGFGDILTIQDEIEQKVLANLQVHLSVPEQQRISKRYTNDPEAFQLYLKGQYEWRKHTQEGIMTGIDFYKQALVKDPNYALAYAGLSASYGVLGNSYTAPSEAFPQARTYAAKALEIDESLPEAHVAMAAVKLYFDWDGKAAVSELDRAQALDPNNAESYNIRGDFLDATGQFDRSLISRRRAVELDPQSPMYNCNLGITLYNSGQYDEAIGQLERTTDLEPRYVDAWTYLAQAYEQKRMFQQGIDALKNGVAKAERHPQLIALLARNYSKVGDISQSKQALSEIEEMSKRGYVSPYLFALIYDGLGDEEAALGWLEKAYKERSYFMIWLEVDPEFNDLRGDRRFQEMVKRIGLLTAPG